MLYYKVIYVERDKHKYKICDTLEQGDAVMKGKHMKVDKIPSK